MKLESLREKLGSICFNDPLGSTCTPLPDPQPSPRRICPLWLFASEHWARDALHWHDLFQMVNYLGCPVRGEAQTSINSIYSLT